MIDVVIGERSDTSPKRLHWRICVKEENRNASESPALALHEEIARHRESRDAVVDG